MTLLHKLATWYTEPEYPATFREYFMSDRHKKDMLTYVVILIATLFVVGWLIR